MVAMGQNSMQAPQSVHLLLSMFGRTLRHLSLLESLALSQSARIISGSNNRLRLFLRVCSKGETHSRSFSVSVFVYSLKASAFLAASQMSSMQVS